MFGGPFPSANVDPFPVVEANAFSKFHRTSARLVAARKNQQNFNHKFAKCATRCSRFSSVTRQQRLDALPRKPMNYGNSRMRRSLKSTGAPSDSRQR